MKLSEYVSETSYYDYQQKTKIFCIDGGLYGGAYPTYETLEELKKIGVKSIISFTFESEDDAVKITKNPNCYDVDVIISGDPKYHFYYERISIPNYSPCTEKQSSYFVSKVDELLKSGKVFIHCLGGKGRTGMMAMIYLLHKYQEMDAIHASKKVLAKNYGSVEVIDNKDMWFAVKKYEAKRNSDNMPI